MKNPREYTLAEIIAICETEATARDHLEAAQNLFLFLQWREEMLKSYQVQQVREQIKEARAGNTLPQRRCKTLDADLLDSCTLVEA